MSRHYAPQPHHDRQYYAPAAPPRRRRVWPWVLGTLVVLVLAFAGCAAAVGAGLDAATAPKAFTYAVESTGPVTVTSTDGSGTSTVEADDGWSRDVELDGFTPPQVLVQTYDSGTVTCRITDGSGAVVAEQTSNGPGALAHCAPMPG